MFGNRESPNAARFTRPLPRDPTSPAIWRSPLARHVYSFFFAARERNMLHVPDPSLLERQPLVSNTGGFATFALPAAFQTASARVVNRGPLQAAFIRSNGVGSRKFYRQLWQRLAAVTQVSKSRSRRVARDAVPAPALPGRRIFGENSRPSRSLARPGLSLAATAQSVATPAWLAFCLRP